MHDFRSGIVRAGPRHQHTRAERQTSPSDAVLAENGLDRITDERRAVVDGENHSGAAHCITPITKPKLHGSTVHRSAAACGHPISARATSLGMSEIGRA